MSNNIEDIFDNDKNLSNQGENAAKGDKFRTQLIINLSRKNPGESLKDPESRRNRHITFCTDNFPERRLIRAPKVIKLKITVPNGRSRNSESEKKELLESSSKLTQTDNISVDPNSKSLSNFNEEDAFEGEFIPPHKSSQILEPDDSKPEFKSHCDFSVEDEEEIGKSITYPPVMGKKALLAKIRAAKNRPGEALSDSEIIRRLVEERFHKFLRSYYEKSFKRAQRSMILDNVDVPVRNRSDSKSDGGIGSSETNSSSSSLNTSAYSISTQNSGASKKTGCESLKDDDHDGKFVYQDNLEYDAKTFLRDALGEEADVDGSVCFDTSLNETDSTLHSKQSSQNRVSGDRSIGTLEVSALLSKTSSLQSSISKRARGSVTPAFKQEPIDEERIRKTSAEEEQRLSLIDEKLAELALESAVQHQILLQTSKALNFCRKTKEFISSREQVEAERILLIAACKREIIVKELHRLEFEEAVEADCKNSGTVTISNVKFSTKRDPPNRNKRRNKEFLQWSVCIASCGLKLSASEVVLPEEDGAIRFANCFEFDRLPPDFEIHLAIYSLRMKNTVRNYSHESKFRLNQDEKTTCPTPQQILHMHKDKNKPRSKEEPLIRTSSFTLWGRTTLRIADLFRPTFKLSNVPACSNLDETLTMNVTSSIELDERYSGFLNVGSESGDTIIWNRRWCCLHGHEMRYWNYPCEEDVTEAIGAFDLKCCANSSISMADRVSCPRSKTLLLEIVAAAPNKEPEERNIITRHFLNADTLEDMNNWENCLNAVIVSLRNWNATKTKNPFKRNAL